MNEREEEPFFAIVVLTWLAHVHGLYLSIQHAREGLLVRGKFMKLILSGGKAESMYMCVSVCARVHM